MSDPKEFRKRLEALNRDPLPEREPSEADVEGIRRKLRKLNAEAGGPAAGPQKILYRRDAPVRQPRPPADRGTNREPVALEEAVQGIERDSPHGGVAYFVAVPLSDLEGDWCALCESFCGALEAEDSTLTRRLADACGTGRLLPDDVIFVDIETTGLGSSPLFLIGTMTWNGSEFEVRQYLARDYAEERAAISLFLDDACDKKLLVTFNGKTFDLPYIRVRAAANAIPCAIDSAHFDLLHESRRIWGQALPDCKLQTLERAICRRVRRGDIPGSEIPDAYHAFVRTCDATEIVEILKHNLFDLITLADLMTRLPEPTV